MSYTVYATRNMPEREIEDNGAFETLHDLLEGIAQDMRVYPNAISYTYVIVPRERGNAG